MRINHLGVMLTLAATSLLQAAPVTFNMTSGGGVGTFGNVLTYANGGITTTVTSWTILTDGGNFTPSATGRWSGGLGVCNTSETITSCGSPHHTMDNRDGQDFLLFQFNANVDPASLVLREYSTTDSDVSYWTGNVTFSAGWGLALSRKTCHRRASCRWPQYQPVRASYAHDRYRGAKGLHEGVHANGYAGARAGAGHAGADGPGVGRSRCDAIPAQSLRLDLTSDSNREALSRTPLFLRLW